jgi:hypothetical protein
MLPLELLLLGLPLCDVKFPRGSASSPKTDLISSGSSLSWLEIVLLLPLFVVALLLLVPVAASV